LFILNDEQQPKREATAPSPRRFEVPSTPPLVVEWSSGALEVWSRAYGDAARNRETNRFVS
jgi:hypothetical protein